MRRGEARVRGGEERGGVGVSAVRGVSGGGVGVGWGRSAWSWDRRRRRRRRRPWRKPPAAAAAEAWAAAWAWRWRRISWRKIARVSGGASDWILGVEKLDGGKEEGEDDLRERGSESESGSVRCV